MAAIASSNTTSMFINRIAAFINQTPSNRALTDLYSASTGESATLSRNGERASADIVDGVATELRLTTSLLVL